MASHPRTALAPLRSALAHGRAPIAAAIAPPPLPEAFDRASNAATALADIIDRATHAAAARYTGGLSPMAIGGAFLDWASHLAFSPGKQLQLAQKGARKAMRLANYAARASLPAVDGERCIEPLPQDHRFDDPAWRRWPHNVAHQAFLLAQQWWHNALID